MLWRPPAGVTLLGPRRHVAQDRIVTLPTGERVRVWVDDSGTVTQIEHDHTLDAVVRPQTIRVKMRRPDAGC
jgi:hypothetical protein